MEVRIPIFTHSQSRYAKSRISFGDKMYQTKLNYCIISGFLYITDWFERSSRIVRVNLDGSDAQVFVSPYLLSTFEYTITMRYIKFLLRYSTPCKTSLTQLEWNSIWTEADCTGPNRIILLSGAISRVWSHLNHYFSDRSNSTAQTSSRTCKPATSWCNHTVCRSWVSQSCSGHE